jgi:S-DNA-T family DNA segregation ATPase FtsK/SpoIIIE
MGRKRESASSSLWDRLPRPALNLAAETKRGIAVIIFILLAGLTGLSLLHQGGSFGNQLALFLASVAGYIAYAIPLLFLAVAVALFRHDVENESGAQIYARTYVGALIIAAALAGLVHVPWLRSEDAFSVAADGKAGGYLGAIVAGPLFSLFELWGASLILILFLVIGCLITFNLSLKSLIPNLRREPKEKEVEKKNNSDVKINTMSGAGFVTEKIQERSKKAQPISSDEDAEEQQPAAPKIITPVKVAPVEAEAMDAVMLEDRKDWKLPPFDLLDDNQTEVDSGNIEQKVAIIQKTLHDFGIEVEMGEVNVGPTVTQYTLRPANGVKLAQIAGLQNDLTLALSAHAIRMELPIPGKPLVGIEVPNKSTAIVRLREVMQTTDFINHKSRLALALGRDVAGVPMIADLAKMPHLLIAGATGTGKSVAINSLFISLLYRNTPQDVKFIVVDPKRVELNLYNGIPHLLTPVITDHEKAVNALKWAVGEMDRRYKLLAEIGKRNILEYNENAQPKLPYIVILVDELADLMAVAQADVEATIVRLAQMARAVGIHLVLATQRPSVEIITGLIKANITSRIAFAVASQIDSRTILDTSGAEKLLGNGDMLFTSADFTKPKRIQGAYLNEKEVKHVVDFFKQQTGAVIYNEEILEKPKRALGIPGMDDDGGSSEDDLFEEAKNVVMQAGKASASLLQRRLRVGYARAARLLDILEDKGIIGPGDGAKPRDVYGAIPDAEKAEYGIESANDEQFS